MKKQCLAMVAVLLLGTLTACSGEESASPPPVADSELPISEPAVESLSDPLPDTAPQTMDEGTQEPRAGDEEPQATTNGILIAYFTMPESGGVDAVSSASRVLVDGQVQGNVQLLAGMIQSATGGDLFTIETVQQYPGEHDALLDFASEEQNSGIRPELAAQIENLEDYDVIFLGYPIWWYGFPMPLYSFLEEYDLEDKIIIPFCVHGGSGFLDTVETIGQLQPNATLLDGFTVSRDSVAGAQGDIGRWLLDLGYTE